MRDERGQRGICGEEMNGKRDVADGKGIHNRSDTAQEELGYWEGRSKVRVSMEKGAGQG